MINKIIDILKTNINIRTIKNLIYDYIYNKIESNGRKFKSGYDKIK